MTLADPNDYSSGDLLSLRGTNGLDNPVNSKDVQMQYMFFFIICILLH